MDQPIPSITLATAFDDKMECNICFTELLKPNHCDFCGQSVCEECCAKRRRFQDGVLHPVCETCEDQFITIIIITNARKEKEQLLQALEQANSELVSKRQQLYSLKNVISPASQNQEQKIHQLDNEIKILKERRAEQIIESQKIEKQKIELKQQIAENSQTLQTKEVKLLEVQSKTQKVKDELEDIQRQIDEFLANLPNLEAEQKSALTQLDISNYEQIFRGSNLQELNQQVKQSQIGQTGGGKKKNSKEKQQKDCKIF